MSLLPAHNSSSSMISLESNKCERKRRRQKRVSFYMKKLCQKIPTEGIKGLLLPKQKEEGRSNLCKSFPMESLKNLLLSKKKEGGNILFGRSPRESSQSLALPNQEERRDTISSPLLRLPKELRDEIYSLVLCTGSPLSSIAANITCSCGTTKIRAAVVLMTELLRTCKQVAEEASHVLYTENIFAIDDSPWPLLTKKSTNRPNRHIFPKSGRPYVKLIRHLNAVIHLSTTFLSKDSDPTGEPGTAPTKLDLKGMCKWYYETLKPICFKQLENFPELQSLTISITEHLTSMLRDECGELFVLKIWMNRRIEKPHLFNPTIPLDASPMPNAAWKSLENIESEDREDIEAFAEEDPKPLLFLPLRSLRSVVRIEAVPSWREKRMVTVLGKSIEEIVPCQRNWTFSSVDQFLTYAGEGLSNFSRTAPEIMIYS